VLNPANNQTVNCIVIAKDGVWHAVLDTRGLTIPDYRPSVDNVRLIAEALGN